MQTEQADIDSMEAGRELDALVAERVMGLVVVWDEFSMTYAPGAFYPEAHTKVHRTPVIGDKDGYAVPDYSTDITDAWQVVEAMTARGYSVATQILSPKEPQSVRIYRIGGQYMGASYAPNMPLAICRAALKVVQNTP